KYEIAAAKRQMSILGGTRRAAEAEATTRLGGAANNAMALATMADIVSNAMTQARVNAMENVTGFHLAIDGTVQVTNLQKYGDTLGSGAQVQYQGITFTLDEDGNWTSPSGYTLTQNDDGTFHIGPEI